jgi:hypothetical protein
MSPLNPLQKKGLGCDESFLTDRMSLNYITVLSKDESTQRENQCCVNIGEGCRTTGEHVFDR